MMGAFRSIYSNHGVIGLWKGTSSSIPRISLGSGVQLSTFQVSLEFIQANYKTDSRWLNVLMAGMTSGLVISVLMNPFDLLATRFYNQETDKHGKGSTYKSVGDCAVKIWKKEGFRGFYKGWFPHYLRIGPHTLLSLAFWEQLRYYYKNNFKTGTSTS
jgi:solute carrier family 25 protein 34/35